MTYRSYFQAQAHYVWQWEENGAVVAIPNGSTIAYRALLTEILHQLAPQGLPPFGSLLMTMVATNPNGEQGVRVVEALIAQALPTLSPDGFLQREISEALALLHRLAQLPDAYQQGQKRLLLLQTLFYKAHNALSAHRSKAYLRELAEEPAVRAQVFRTQSFDVSVLYRDLKTLTIAARRFPTNERLLQAVHHVPDLTDDAPDLPVLSPESLVDALLTNPQTFSVGALIRSLWAGLTMPAPHSLPTVQPLGGVLDLTNKGPLDRLLLTEFAQDDLLLLSRLANGEALFLNRERPPASPETERIFLIDVSLKAWGTPRTLAFALLVALAHHPRKAVSSRAYVVGQQATPIAFNTPDALIDSLLHLSPVLHPVAGLTAFMQETPRSPQIELVLLTTPDALQQPDMQRWLTDYQAALSYLLTTQTDGTVTVYRPHRHRRQHLQTLTLPLARLWQKPRVSAVDTTVAHLAVSSYPILFPYAGQGHALLPVGADRWLRFSPDRGLLLYRESKDQPYQHGWELLTGQLPVRSAFRAVTQISDGAVVVLLLDHVKKQLYLLNLVTQQTQTVAFPDWKQHSRYAQFMADRGVFYYMAPSRQHWTIRASDGHITRHESETDAAIIDRWVASVGQTNEWAGQLPKQSVLKNVSRVFVDEHRALTVNGHRLLCADDGKIWFQSWPSAVAVMAQQQQQRTEFRFPDGSTVRVLREGMLVLQSSQTTLPAIYIPLVVDQPLGLVAGDVFSGNPYFQRRDQIQQQPTQTPGLFWQTYMNPFIDCIINYDAGRQTTRP